ncbi:hypothetical protein [Flavobacterium sp.]|uniref:hypothetical protein n=1 Tax=Flavobacterium sp. TaxID=239 RepID=UPI004047C215
MKTIILYLALFTFSISCKNNSEKTVETTIISNQENSLIPFESSGDDFIYKDYILKSNSVNNSFELFYGQKLIGEIDFENIEYEGPGFLAYMSELDNGIKNILIEATSDIGTAWYYSVVLENNVIINKFFIKEPRTDSENYSLDKFISLSIINDAIEYRFDKKNISKYSTIPKDAIIDEEYIYLTKEIKSKNVEVKNELDAFLIEIKNDTKYTLVFNKSHDINLDGIDDRFFVQKNNLEFTSDKEETKLSKIILFISSGDSYIKMSNTTIFPNDSNDQFETIDFKKNYFTIKLFNEVPDQYFIEKYITFKLSDNLIKLNKFSKITNDKQTDVNILNTEEILFESYNSNNDRFK